MSNTLRFALATLLVSIAFTSSVCAIEDTIELKNGAKLHGKIIARDSRSVTLEVEVRGKTFQRKYDLSRIKSIDSDGDSAVPADSMPDVGGPPKTASRQEVLQLIDSVGRTPPDWFESTDLDYPQSLDLSWPKPAPSPWDSSKNVGQFIWDRINPNPSKWRSGVKLMHHIMTTQSDDKETVHQAMMALGNMYHNLHEDYARAAFWWQQAGVDRSPEIELNAALHLADCYRRLGNREMAIELVHKMGRYPLGTIKLLGDLGETRQALEMAEQFAKGQNTTESLLYAGDVCRVSGDLDEAEKYYRRAVDSAPQGSRNEDYARRNRERAQASLAAIKFYRLNPKQIQDGTYSASSYGYEDQVTVEVVVSAGRIESVKVTQHREKQFYSSIEDTPRRIVERQSLTGIDTTSGATITSEAIINATAKALAEGLQ